MTGRFMDGDVLFKFLIIQIKMNKKSKYVTDFVTVKVYSNNTRMDNCPHFCK